LDRTPEGKYAYWEWAPFRMYLGPNCLASVQQEWPLTFAWYDDEDRVFLEALAKDLYSSDTYWTPEIVQWGVKDMVFPILVAKDGLVQTIQDKLDINQGKPKDGFKGTEQFVDWMNLLFRQWMNGFVMTYHRNHLQEFKERTIKGCRFLYLNPDYVPK
jgi:hypothetical protein